jgi:hypothetical protein
MDEIKSVSALQDKAIHEFFVREHRDDDELLYLLQAIAIHQNLL